MTSYFLAFEKVGEDETKNKLPLFKATPKKEPMQVVLRIKPFTDKDLNKKENQGMMFFFNSQFYFPTSFQR